MTVLEPELSWFNPDLKQNAFIQGKLPWIIIFSYIMFVKVFGPIIMKERKPLDPKRMILTYNSFMVVANIGLCYYGTLDLVELWPYQCDFRNGPVYTERERFFFIARYALFVKYCELFDTVFFILRKKFNQASFLHVFHHAIMCTLGIACVKFDLHGYYQFLIVSVNSGIHVLLYSYYALSGVRPDIMRKYIWCKKYLTTLQIMQFFLFMVYMLYSNLFGCGFDMLGFDSFAFFTVVIITVLFFNFYFRTYK